MNDKEKWHLNETICDRTIAGTVEGSGGYMYGVRNQLCKLNIANATFDHRDNWTCTLESCKVLKEGGCASKHASQFLSSATINVEVE